MSRRVVLGSYGPGSGFGLRVSIPGADALSTDPADLIFDSDWPAILPIHLIAIVALTDPGSANISFPALDYNPLAAVAVRPEGWTGSNLGITGWNLQHPGGDAFSGSPDQECWSSIHTTFNNVIDLAVYADHATARYTRATGGSITSGMGPQISMAVVIYRYPAGR